MVEKVLKWRDSIGELGTLGDSTSHPDFKIGDVIVYKNIYMNDQLIKTIICNDNRGNDFPMGLGGRSISKLVKETEVIKVIGYEYLSNEFIEEIHSSIMIVENEVFELTKNEIETRLGYKIKIV